MVLWFPQQKGGAGEHTRDLETAEDSGAPLSPCSRWGSISFADSPCMPGTFLHHLMPVLLTETLFWMQKTDALFLRKKKNSSFPDFWPHAHFQVQLISGYILLHVIVKEEINRKPLFFSRCIAVSSSCTPFPDQGQRIHY